MTINNYWNTGEHAAPERVDHVAEAGQHIAWAHEQQKREGDMGNVPRDNALLAQAHATLALVEQQRIANVLAIAHWTSTEHLGYKLDTLRMGVAVEVWEGLGL